MVGVDIANPELKKTVITALLKKGYMFFCGHNTSADLIIAEDTGEESAGKYFPAKTVVIGADEFSSVACLCDRFVLEPVDINRLMEIVESMTEREKDYSKKTADCFLDLGVSPLVKGYTFLKDAVNMYISHRDYPIKEIYGLVACYRGTTPQRVERNIRYSIETAFNKCRLESHERVFKNSINPLKGKPTNMEFICRIADMAEKEK